MGDKVLAKVAAGDVDRLRKEAERKKDLRHNVRAMKEKEAEYKENLQSRVAEKVQARGLLMETVRPRYEREALAQFRKHLRKHGLGDLAKELTLPP
mmetsp:Transcript_28171/g.74375  ORF Transcript_28171/g.74375 Transcript_28171/m.74375 type:complete len:96 (+) Transcript_28171:369-656(+)